jgi:hypothetical protein
MKANGRPRAKLDPAEVEKLARIGATQREIAAWFKISKATVERHLRNPRLHEMFERGNAAFDLSIRRKQAELAMAGNVTMLIWLGKQRLGQRDRFDTEHSGSEGGPIQVIIMPSAEEE